MLARLFTIATLAVATLTALDPKSLQPQGYINDFAGVVDASARADVNRYCAAVERATGAQIAIVTVKSLDGAPVEDFANDLFRQWGIGQKGTKEGVLLLFAIDDRHSRFEVGRGLEPVITDGTAGTILREMRPALRSNDYSTAFSTAAHEIGQRIASAKGVTIEESARPQRRSRNTGGGGFEFNDIIFLFLSVAMILWIVSRVRGGGGRGGGYRAGGGGGGFLPGLILGNMLGGRGPSYGGNSGGGFGGYDSGGGGFGGFGGGDSGGGGASSDW